MKPLRKPCDECPFRRQSLAGYLGPYEPYELVRLIETTPFPCHRTITEPGMADGDPRLRACTGAAIYLNNKCALSRDPGMATAQKDLKAIDPLVRKSVFSNSVEFLMHHLREGREAVLAKLSDPNRFF